MCDCDLLIKYRAELNVFPVGMVLRDGAEETETFLSFGAWVPPTFLANGEMLNEAGMPVGRHINVDGHNDGRAKVGRDCN